ncbi:hypothetical protein SLEP1_g14222 [Rubroshorea leprosula]|uniref:Uncharacterized protein n=1 Tax=Rubroshorea leprosula TaxID=152421 RepID=A0AAV5IIC7_9ROSI|nr:hypothetical protein SLEP1_g14222 [Rubroshorea leprosula]
MWMIIGKKLTGRLNEEMTSLQNQLEEWRNHLKGFSTY